MSDNPGAQPGGQLLALPSEVRLLIYEMIFPPCRVDLYTSKWVDGGDHSNRSPAILATCQTIHTEAKPVLYENTEFHVGLTCDPLAFEDSLPEDDDDAALDDLYQHARPHIDQMRKLSLKIALTNSYNWGEPEDNDRWFEELASELALLSEAPYLTKVLVTLETNMYNQIAEDIDRIITSIGLYVSHVTVTTEIDPSLKSTDFQPSSYYAKLNKLKWVDTTQEAYSNKLADLTNQRSQIVRKTQERSTWAAAKSAEYRDIVNNDNFFEEDSPLREQARLMSGEVEMRFHEILEWENELMDLRKEITSTKEYLRWVAESRSKHHQAA